MFGFIDDMTMKILYNFDQTNYFTVFLQSELRIGVGDLNKNIEHNDSILKCLDLNTTLKNVGNPCFMLPE